jgi:hypothetical protein
VQFAIHRGPAGRDKAFGLLLWRAGWVVLARAGFDHRIGLGTDAVAPWSLLVRDAGSTIDHFSEPGRDSGDPSALSTRLLAIAITS